MTSDQDPCGLISLLPMSCQKRAKDFARRLHSRLSSLDSTDNCVTANEHSWLATPENSLTSSQPRQTNSDLYFDLEDLESPPGSPEEEVDTQSDQRVINEDNLSLHSSDYHYPVLNEKGHHVINKNERTDNCHNLQNTEDNINRQKGGNHTDGNEEDIVKKTKEGSLEEKVNQNILGNFRQCESSTDDAQSVLNLEEYINSHDNNSLSIQINSTIKDEKLESVDNSDCYLNKNGLSCLDVEKSVPIECSNLTVTSESTKQKTNNFGTESVYDHDDQIDEPTPRVRRCTSLKTGKTPPGTPGRKKIVRFADVLGLDLADVRTFLDEIPKIPNSAYNDLKDVDLTDSLDTNVNTIFSGVKIDKVLVPLFQQPGGQPDFINRVRDNQVCLDNALVDDPVTLTITGTVRVRNLDFHKSVHVRYTVDSWQNFSDVQATYVENSCDGFSDKFSFRLFADTLSVGQRLEFAVRFQCKGSQFWDNNKGINYCFQCLPTDNNVPESLAGNDENWSPNLYY